MCLYLVFKSGVISLSLQKSLSSLPFDNLNHLLLSHRWEPGSHHVQCEVCLQQEGSGTHAATEGGSRKWFLPCQQQVWPQPHTPPCLWNHPAGTSPHWPGGLLWLAGEQLRALRYPSSLRGGGVWAGLSLFVLLLSLKATNKSKTLSLS